MKKKIYLGILFLVFFACFFGFQNPKKATRYVPIAPQNNNANKALGFNSSFPVSTDLQKRYQEAFIHDFVTASIQPNEEKELILRVRMNRNHRLRIVTLKSSGLFQLDQVARNTIESRPYWLEADKTYDLHFQYDPNWDQKQYKINQNRFSTESQNPPFESSRPPSPTPVAVPPFPSERSNVHPPDLTRSSLSQGKAFRKPSFDLTLYQSEVVSKVTRFYHPPTGFERARVTGQFMVMHNGELGDLRVTRSSGNPEVDKAFLRAVRLAAPFRAFPAGYFERGYIIFLAMGENHHASGMRTDSYFRLLRIQIIRNWHPSMPIGEKRVQLEFTVDNTGTPSNIEIVMSSGDAVFDGEAVGAIRSAKHLPPLPSDMQNHQNKFIWTFDKHTREQ